MCVCVGGLVFRSKGCLIDYHRHALMSRYASAIRARRNEEEDPLSAFQEKKENARFVANVGKGGNTPERRLSHQEFRASQGVRQVFSVTKYLSTYTNQLIDSKDLDDDDWQLSE